MLRMDPLESADSLQKTSPHLDPAAMPTMDTGIQILRLRQGNRSIEKYVEEFIELTHLTSMSTECLMIFFRGGLSEPLSSSMPLHDPHWTLEHYIDLALLLSGSSFTVGVVEEELCEPTVSPPAETESLHVSPTEPELLHVSSAEPALHVTSADTEPALHVSSAEPALHVTSADTEPALHVSPAEPALHVTSADPETVHVSPADPALHVTSTDPETVHVTSTDPEIVHVTSADPEIVHVTSADPETVHVSPAEPALHVTSADPETVHVTSAKPGSPDNMAAPVSVPNFRPGCLHSRFRPRSTTGPLHALVPFPCMDLALHPSPKTTSASPPS